ncbi:MAG: von Willebrand factor type A domain-containing protein [Planctomycetes bacterium]|nr:von Willebrand factor type A domain-containing protein [Planctomycetota bacterium]
MSSNNNAPINHNNDNPIEGWFLTAYALGELDQESQDKVEAWLAKHPEGLREIEAIRQTASKVQQELAISAQSIQLDPTRTDRVRESIAIASQNADARKDLEEIKRSGHKKVRQRRFLMAMTAGLAAGLAGTAFWLSTPNSSEEFSLIQIEPLNARVLETTATEWTEENSAREQSGLALTPKSPSSLPEILARDYDESKTLSEGVDDYLVKDSKSQEWFGKKADSLQDNVGRLSRSVAAADAAQGLPSFQTPAGPGFGLPGGGGGLGGAMGGQGRGSGGPSKALSGGESAATVRSEDRFRRETGTDKTELEAELDLKQDSLGIFPEELKQNVPSLSKSSKANERVSGDRFDWIPETPFVSVQKEPLSTFSIDVDTASYSKLRQYVLENKVVPPPSAIRIEEWLNYFDYQYPGPQGNDPFAAHMKLGDCPWNTKHKIVRVALQAKKVASQDRPKSNLVFLIDVSGSMGDANKLPLVKRTLNLLTAQLREQDKVAIVVYAGASGCVLPSTRGAHKDQILASINELQSGGSTNGGSGIELAYKIAKENFIPGGVNRVLLCTDGDFNVGVTGTDALVSMMQEQAKSNIFLTCLGYGIGNYNDSMMEQISDKGNGTYAMVDSESEARRVMTEQLSGTLMTVAKDVKIQIEFNPAKVHSYRLIGYENRRLAAADFNNDKKDAGEIGAGHRVTALYEVVPIGQADSIPGAIDELRFSQAGKPETKLTEVESASKEWLLLKIRSKQPESSESTKQEFVLGDVASTLDYEGQQSDFDWALSIAEFGLLMRRSELAPSLSWEKMLARAMDSTASDPYRQECITIMQRARSLSGQ